MASEDALDRGTIAQAALFGGEGRLTNRIDECLRFVLGLDCVDCFSIGCESPTQLDDLMKRIAAAGVA